MYLTLKLQDLSNGEIEKEAYDKSRDKLAEDPQWQAWVCVDFCV